MGCCHTKLAAVVPQPLQPQPDLEPSHGPLLINLPSHLSKVANKPTRASKGETPAGSSSDDGDSHSDRSEHMTSSSNLLAAAATTPTSEGRPSSPRHQTDEERPLPPPAPTGGSNGEACTLECRCAGDALALLDPAAWIDGLPEAQRAVEAKWRDQLTDTQFKVLRMKGTEEIHSGEYNEHFEDGTYACSGCGLALYDSSHKFKSGHGWPAFADNLDGALTRVGAKGKVEIVCSGCSGHVGHVFKSTRYPKPHHERHCSNSASLRFVPRAEQGT